MADTSEAVHRLRDALETTDPPSVDLGTSKLAAALAKVQADLLIVPKGQKADAGQYSYTYADLASVWRTVSPLTSKHGIAVVQHPMYDPAGRVVSVRTQLLHTSGQMIESTLSMPVAKDTPQGVGTAISYCRRYALCALVGVATEDTDAQEHEAAPKPMTKAPPDPDTERGDLPEDVVYIRDIKTHSGATKTGKQWTLWRVTTSQGETLKTFEEGVATAARNALDAQRPVTISSEPDADPQKDHKIIEIAPWLDPNEPELPI